MLGSRMETCGALAHEAAGIVITTQGASASTCAVAEACRALPGARAWAEYRRVSASSDATPGSHVAKDGDGTLAGC